MKRKFLYLLTLLVLILAVAIEAPRLVLSKIKNIAKEQLALNVNFDDFSFNIFTLKAQIDNLTIKDYHTNALLFTDKNIAISLSSKSLIFMYPIIDSIEINSPIINIERFSNGKFNFQKYIPTKKDERPNLNAKKSLFQIKNITIKGGALNIKDEILKLNESFTRINLTACNISNLDTDTDKPIDANLSFVALGGKFTINSKLKPFKNERQFNAKIKIDSIPLAKFTTFLPKDINKLTGDFSCDATIDTDIGIKTKVGITGLIDIKNLISTIQKQIITSSNIALSIDTVVAENLNDSAKIDIKAKEIGLNANNLTFIDKSKRNEFKLASDNISLKLKNISNKGKDDMSISGIATLTKNSTISIDGNVSLAEKSANILLEAKKISLLPIKTLEILPPKIELANGFAYMKGSFIGSLENNKTTVSYKGRAGIEKLSLYDKTKNTQILSLENLNLSGIDINSAKNSIKLASINVDGIKTFIIIDKQKKLNLAELFEQNTTATAKSGDVKKKSTLSPSVSIGAIVVQNGTITFVDDHIAPNFKAYLSGLSGRVTSLRLNKNELSKIELIGTFNNQGKIDIKGLLVPNPKNFYLNIKSDIKDIGMPAFSSYTGKYIGYNIDSGTLGLELNYNVVGKELSLDNQISLFGFNLGKEIDSPNAVKLPYNLAIAILKDSNNNIHIELPVEGKTDDPQIRSGKVIWKLISQLITKIVTAPFKFIGSLFDGGEEMGYVEFDYGRSIITAVENEKLLKIIKVLKQKPTLKVQIEGFVDGEKDYEALRNLEFHKKLAIQKLKEQKKPLDLWMNTKIEPSEFDKYLLAAYKVEKFAKPTNMLGFDKSIPSEDMKNLILTHIDIGEKQMLELSNKRAETIKKFIISNGIDPARVSLTQAKMAAPEQKEKIKNSRVDIKFVIK